MEPELMQDPNVNNEMSPEGEMQEMNPDEAAASLAFVTQLSEGMMPKMQPVEEEEVETVETEDDKEEEKDTIREIVREEMKSLRDELKSILDDEESETKETDK